MGALPQGMRIMDIGGRDYELKEIRINNVLEDTEVWHVLTEGICAIYIGSISAGSNSD